MYIISSILLSAVFAFKPSVQSSSHCQVQLHEQHEPSIISMSSIGSTTGYHTAVDSTSSPSSVSSLSSSGSNVDASPSATTPTAMTTSTTTQRMTYVPPTLASAAAASFPMRSYGKWCPSQQGATLVWRDVCVYATNVPKANTVATTNDTVPKKSVFGNRIKGIRGMTKNVLQLKRIINNATGAIRPGTLMALMGSR